MYGKYISYEIIPSSYIFPASRVGSGVLIRFGDFYWPGRLICRPLPDEQDYTVKIWNGCYIPPEFNVSPGNITYVSAEDIVDELWCDRLARRQIRVRCSFFLNFLISHTNDVSLEDGSIQDGRRTAIK